MSAASRTVAAGGTIARPQRSVFITRAPLRIAIVVICLIWSLPTVGLFVSSLRDARDITRTGWWDALLAPWAARWTVGNYQDVLGTENMGNAFINSLIVTIPSTVIPITVAAFAAYAFAWMRFPLRRTLFLLVVALLVVPLQMALIPVLDLYRTLGITNSFLGVWLAHTAFGLPLAIFLLYNFISQLPNDLFETASIDGATHFQMFTRVVLPLSVPALAAFAIFQFLWVWNDLLVALVFLSAESEQSVMTLELSRLVGGRGQQWHLLTAGAFVTMILPVTVFLLLQRYFVRGILSGSVKG
jgi:alpha-glucoside transport system permease protein